MMDGEVIDNIRYLNTNLTEFMQETAEDMDRSVQLNIDLGGRPAWKPLRNGVTETPLVGTGKMRRAIYHESDANSATCALPNSIVYGAIHNFGGTIKHPGSDKKQTFQVGGKWITTSHTKPHDIIIPMRKFMMFQPQDIEKYKKRLIGAIITIKTDTGITGQL